MNKPIVLKPKYVVAGRRVIHTCVFVTCSLFSLGCFCSHFNEVFKISYSSQVIVSALCIPLTYYNNYMWNLCLSIGRCTLKQVNKSCAHPEELTAILVPCWFHFIITVGLSNFHSFELSLWAENQLVDCAQHKQSGVSLSVKLFAIKRKC